MRACSLVAVAGAVCAAAVACSLVIDPDELTAGVSSTDGSEIGLGTARDGDLVVTTPTVVSPATEVVVSSAPGANRIEVGDASKIGEGAVVLFVQNAHAFPSAVGSRDAITLGASGLGNFALARVVRIEDRALVLDRALPSAFFVRGAQAVHVPEYGSVTVRREGSIDAPPWDGKSGGVVAFLARGAITNDGKISAEGAGFRGGPAFPKPHGSNSCGLALEGDPDAGYAARGEGVVTGSFWAGGPNAAGGRGNVANGAGGGNCHNAGGGGGASAGAGGDGAPYDKTIPHGGLGGVAYDVPDRPALLFGGGGGSGDGEIRSGEKIVPGGAGGGVVFFRGRSLLSGGVISASGIAGESAAGNGSAGGGAGGTIMIEITDKASCAGFVRANGGAGGAPPNAAGGGGGGGLVLQKGAQCVATAIGGIAPRVDGTEPPSQPGKDGRVRAF